MAFMRCLIESGAVVKFWPDNLHYDRVYAPALQAMGIEVYHGSRWAGEFDALMREQGSEFDVVLLSRPDVAEKYVASVRKHGRARVVFYGHDLHFQRMANEVEVRGGPSAPAQAMEALERRMWRAADVVLYPSQEEADIVRTLEAKVDARAITPYRFDRFGSNIGPGQRSGLVFVAGFAHQPNVDAAVWLVENVMPAVWALRPDARLSLVGSHPTQRVLDLACERVEVTGFVSDFELQERYRRARVAIVPLRYGAGVKSKVVEALQQGLPLVTTPVGAQGLAGLEEVCAVADSPAAVAQAVLEMMNDESLWWQRSQQGALFASERFSALAMQVGLLEACGLSRRENAA